MLLTRLLNACHHFPGFVYAGARLIEARKTIEIEVRPRRGSKARCSGCVDTGAWLRSAAAAALRVHPGVGLRGDLALRMRRVQCRSCGVKVEQVPWATGKHTLTQGLHAVFWRTGRASCRGRRPRGAFAPPGRRSATPSSMSCSGGSSTANSTAVKAIGVDEIAYGRGHQYLTLVYQIESGCTRLLWVGKERTIESFEQFFALIGQELAAKIEFVCSDMWKPYLDLIAKHCTNALNILDRFHVVAKMNLALDDVRAAEARRMAHEGYEPMLKKSRWCLLKRPENLTDTAAAPAARPAALQPAKRARLPAEGRLPAVLGLRLARPGPASSSTNGAPRPCARASTR